MRVVPDVRARAVLELAVGVDDVAQPHERVRAHDADGTADILRRSWRLQLPKAILKSARPMRSGVTTADWCACARSSRRRRSANASSASASRPHRRDIAEEPTSAVEYSYPATDSALLHGRRGSAETPPDRAPALATRLLASHTPGERNARARTIGERARVAPQYARAARWNPAVQ